jgi:putative flippase GtrA
MGSGESAEAVVGPRAMAAVLPSRQFVRFLLVGAVNTAFGYGLFAILVLAGVHYSLAAAVCTVAGVLFNFQTIGRLVFGSRDRWLLWRFTGVYAFTYVLNMAVLRALESTRLHVLIVQAVLVLPMAAIAFVLHRRFVFHREKVNP